MAELDDLSAILKDPAQRSYNKRDAITKIVRLNPPDIAERLATAFVDEDRYVREEAVKQLAATGQAAAAKVLTKHLSKEEDYYVQATIMESLSKLEDPAAIDAIKPFLENSSYSLRSAAERAIKKLEPLAQKSDSEPVAEAESQPEPVEIPEPAPEPEEEPEPEPETSEGLSQPEEEPERQPEPVPEPQPKAEPEAKPPPIPEEKSEAEPPPIPEPEKETEAREEPPPIPEPVEEEAKEAELEPPPVPEEEAGDPELEKVIEELPEDPTQPEEKVEAGTEETEAEEPPSELAEVPAVPDPEVPDVDWGTARRMKAFFGDEFNDVAELYKHYFEYVSNLPKQEYLSTKALGDLRLIHADKDDDVAVLDKEIDSIAAEVRSDERHAKNLKRRIGGLRTKADSAFTQFLSAFSTSFPEGIDEQVAGAERELAQVEEKIKEKTQKMRKLILTRKTLAERIASLTEESEGSTKAAEELRKNLTETDLQINDRILHVLQTRNDDQLSSIGSELAKHAVDSSFVDFCFREIKREAREYRENADLLRPARENLESAVMESAASTQAVGQTIAEGFSIQEHIDDVRVRLKGTLKFEEESGFWSGFSNASGSASGSGTARGKYKVQEVFWHPGDETDDAVNRFTDCWQSLGDNMAKVEFLESLRRANQVALYEYVHFLRTELERDFGDS